MKSKQSRIFLLCCWILVCGLLMLSQGCASLPGAGKAIDIKANQIEVMGKLCGVVEISGGVKAANRNTLENRQAARKYLLELFNEMGYEGLSHAYAEDEENIYAVLAADKGAEEYVLLGAHYDSVRNCPGANDNASGVAVVLAAAEALREVKGRSRNFIFVLFDMEERGMKGSKAFAQKLLDENLKVHSVHTIDQMGWDEDGDRAIELEIPYEGAVELYEEAAQLLDMDITIHITPEAGSDHSAFRRQEFPAVGITEEYRNGDTTPYYHRPTDTFETINFDYLESSTRLIIKVMELLAK
ncbi:MAG: M20/M25/M40 family metallo-hydrolase [Planctomycetes bacterium]|nr:M20/M25/M40 family metallo-hydrolase [Planctomycetota bacterium]